MRLRARRAALLLAGQLASPWAHRREIAAAQRTTKGEAPRWVSAVDADAVPASPRASSRVPRPPGRTARRAAPARGSERCRPPAGAAFRHRKVSHISPSVTSASASNGCVCVSTIRPGDQQRSFTSSAPVFRETHAKRFDRFGGHEPSVDPGRTLDRCPETAFGAATCLEIAFSTPQPGDPGDPMDHTARGPRPRAGPDPSC